MQIIKRIPQALALLGMALTLAVASKPAAAQTPDAPWPGSGTPTKSVISDGTSAPAQFQYNTVANREIGASGSYTFSVSASRTRTVVLKYTYTGFSASFMVKVALQAFNGATTAQLVNDGPVNCCTPPSGGFSYTGTIAVAAKAGQTYGFNMATSNFDAHPVL
jgi:hypothetical protein